VSDLIKSWRKLSENKKMIHNTPQFMQMILMLEEQDKRIAELEKRLSNAETIGSKAQAKRDLEQQAKGLSEYVTQVMDFNFIAHLSESEPYQACLIGVNAKALKLRKQAKQLKGGAE
tara:strand:- start:28 stop:378 length:351 start_codon:yes stop_codon:yes gene_type:complete